MKPTVVTSVGFELTSRRSTSTCFMNLIYEYFQETRKTSTSTFFKLSKSHIIALTLFVVMPDVGQLKALERGRRRQTFVFL